MYIGTTVGQLYCFGSPVNLPLTCTSPVDFGTAAIGNTSQVQTVQCQANVNTQVTAIALSGNPNFQLSGLPTLPFTVQSGQNVSFQATFAPTLPGLLSSDVLLNTTNGVVGYSSTTPVSLKGTGTSQAPILGVNPNEVSFTDVITGQVAGGVTQSFIMINQGDSTLHIAGYDYSTISETGALTTPNTTANGPQVGPFTFEDFPQTIGPDASVTVTINFNPTTTGNYAVYLNIRSDGGAQKVTIVGTAGTYPKALIEFQKSDGSGTYLPYTYNNPPFTFGQVTEQNTEVLKMRLTNDGGISANDLSVTVSKPPFGVAGIVGAQNAVDLAEGTILSEGESATANLYCSVPKSQVNVDSYNGTAQWTLNVGDPSLGKQYIQFTCQAVSEQVGPLFSNGSAIYRYTGCFKENNPGRQLSVQLYGSNNNTPEMCINACSSQGYTYAGVQYNTEVTQNQTCIIGLY